MRAAALVAIAFLLAPHGSAQADPETDPLVTLINRLSLDRYKETIRALTKFGDRREGTDRNRAALDWIEAQLKSYGCVTERLRYTYQPPSPSRAPVLTSRAPDQIENAAGGRMRGNRNPTFTNTDANQQPDPKLRELNKQSSTPGVREEIFCTKIGSTHPDEMYIVGAHMDGTGFGEGANDDASGTALVMEVARVLFSTDVSTERSVRFILFNSEEAGMIGARAYIDQRKSRQGKEDPSGSGQYPEPKWLGMIQHDMLLFDHGMPNKDGRVSDQQRAEADINIEFQSNSVLSSAAQELAWAFELANEQYATDYPAAVGNHMTNTDSDPFEDLVPSISLRELERIPQIGAGWDPTHHQPTDVFSHFSDADFRLGLNAAQTTLGAIATLAAATLE